MHGRQRLIHRSPEGPVTSGFWALTLGQHRRGLWRHRHEPALRLPRSGGRRGARTGRSRRDIVLGVLSLILWALIIVVTVKYVAAAAARRQQRRGRHALADGAGPARARAAAAGSLLALGVHRRLDVHRRFRDHAGDLGAVGGRGPQARDAGASSTTCVPLTIVDPDRAVRGAAPRHRARRVRFRAGHGGLVRRHRRRWGSCTSATIRRCFAAINPLLRAVSSCRRTARSAW